MIVQERYGYAKDKDESEMNKFLEALTKIVRLSY